jgi:hypothetical protein
MAKIKLPRELRDTLETYGVIEPPAVPKLEQIEEAVRERDGRMDLAIGRDGLTAARIELGGAVFTASNDFSGLAAVDALCQALRATQPFQRGLFGDDDDSGVGGGVGPEDEGPRGPSHNGGGDAVIGEYRAIEPGTTMRVSELTGEEFTRREPVELPVTRDADDAGDGELEVDPNSEIRGTVETVANLSDREYSIFCQHAVDLRQTEKPLSVLQDRVAELERRLASPALREKNAEAYRAELRATTEAIARMQERPGIEAERPTGTLSPAAAQTYYEIAVQLKEEETPLDELHDRLVELTANASAVEGLEWDDLIEAERRAIVDELKRRLRELDGQKGFAAESEAAAIQRVLEEAAADATAAVG